MITPKKINLTPADIQNLDEATARIAFDSLKDAYDAENTRHANLIAKAQSLTTVSAIIFASLSLSSFTILYSQTSAVLAFGAGLVSIFFSLETLASK
jgi:hypothetical protein